MRADGSSSLDRLLAWLDPDPDRAGERYVLFREELAEYLSRHGAYTVADALADEALDRVNKRLASALLSEHHNATELRNMPALCRALAAAADGPPAPGKRIWELLPAPARELVASVASAGVFGHDQRSRLSRHLNELLRRPDFYRADCFRPSAANGREAESPPVLPIGGDPLSSRQEELERFNRRLLSSSYPGVIEAHLSDVPDAEKLPRCKRYARIVLLEYLKKACRERPLNPDPGEPGRESEFEDEAAADPLGKLIAGEEEAERRLLLDCQDECKRSKLSPRDRVLLDMYYTGVEILSAEDEPLADDSIKAVRRRLAEWLGVSQDTVRVIAHRARKAVLACIVRCMKRRKNS
jgi:hypothetical protein